jgi:hypothetical protein
MRRRRQHQKEHAFNGRLGASTFNDEENTQLGRKLDNNSFETV